MNSSKADELRSDFLFARPSFLEGIARLVDFGGALNVYNTRQDPDTHAVLQDWRAVGHDLEVAAEEVVNETIEADLP